MGMDWVGAVTLVCGVLALLRGVQNTFQTLIVSVLFQAAAAVTVGTNTITPPHLLLAFLAVALLIKGGIGQLAAAIEFPKAGFWLSLFAVWCGISGFFLPRIFEGAIDVYPIAPSAGAAAFHPERLTASGGNVTQSFYVMGSLFLFIAIVSFCTDLRKSLVVCDALILFAAGNVFFAALDLIGFLIGHPDLLDPLHNASYAMHTNEVVAGFHRISGTFSETAAFSFATLGSLPFTLVLYLSGYRSRVTLMLSVSQLALLLFSTSTTACVGLLAVTTYLLVKYALKLRAGEANHREVMFVAAAPLTVVAIAFVALVDGSTWNAITDFLNVVVFDKGSSDSALERSAMNAQAIDNFISTNGLGAGNGSVRTSSFPLALIANVGIFGLLLYGAFLVKALTDRGARSLDREAAMVRDSARAAAFGTLAAATISGALVDMGLLFFIFAALASAMGERRCPDLQRVTHKGAGPYPDILPAHAS